MNIIRVGSVATAVHIKTVKLAASFSCPLKNKGLEMLSLLGENDSDWSILCCWITVIGLTLPTHTCFVLLYMLTLRFRGRMPPPTAFSSFSCEWAELLFQTKFLAVASSLGHLSMKTFFGSDLTF